MQNVKFGSWEPTGLDFAEKIEHVQLMEKKGFDSVWTDDHLIDIVPNIPRFDPYCLLSSFAVNTNRVMLGTGVTDPHRRHPAMLAQLALTLQVLSKGRAILGLGAGEAMNLKPFGISADRAATKLEETVKLIRKLVNGEEISSRSDFYTFDRAYLQLARFYPSVKPLLIYIAANSPKSRKLVGTLSDGWITMLTSPELYGKDLAEIHESSRSAGRKPDDIDTVINVSIAIAKDKETGREAIKDVARMPYLWFPSQMRRLGGKITDKFDWTRLTVTPGVYEEAMKYVDEVPLDLALQTCIYGTVDDCTESVMKYVKAGVKHFIFIPIGSRKDFYQVFSEKIMVHFRT